MTTLQILALRRNAALGKLATLEKRAERLAAPAATVMSAALQELGAALEEMQVATEQLEAQVEEVAQARYEVASVRRQMEELIEILPVPCVWTQPDGEIDEANGAAAALLNVSAARLSRRSLTLFFAERDRFTEGLAALNGGLARSVELPVVVRPRERRPRRVVLSGKRLDHDGRRCWFFLEPPPQPSKPSPDDL